MATRTPTVRASREEIHEALQVVAYFNGSTTNARHELKRRGREVSTSTLAKWRNQHRDIYQACLDNLDDELAARNEQLIREQTEFEHQAMARLRDELPGMEHKDLIAALRNVSQAKGIAAEKIVNPIRGRPTLITEHREPSQLLAEMARIAAMAQPARAADVDSTASEEPAVIGSGE